MIIEGIIKEILERKRITEKFEAQQIVIDTGAKYGNLVPIQFGNDRIDQIREDYLGKMCTIHFEIRGQKYNDRYFVNLDGFKIECQEKIDFNNPSAHSTSSGSVSTPAAPSDSFGQENFDDLPF